MTCAFAQAQTQICDRSPSSELEKNTQAILSKTLNTQKIKSDSEFISPRSPSLENEKIKIKEALAATVQIDNQCSGVYISNEGHILTAAHCITSMLDPSAIEITVVDDFKTRLVTRKKTSFGDSLSYVNLVENGKDSSEILGKVVAMGAGFYVSLNSILATQKNKNLLEEWLEKGYGPPEDYAIIKVEKKDTPCVHVSHKEVTADEKIFSLGFPFDRIPSSPNDEFWAFSKGRVTRGVEENEAFNRLLRKTSPEKRDYYVSIFKHTLNRPGVISSTVDENAGSNGSPLFNNEGELIGLLNAAEIFGFDDTKEYIEGVSQGVSLSKIKAEVQKEFGNELVQRAFNCK